MKRETICILLAVILLAGCGKETLPIPQHTIETEGCLTDPTTPPETQVVELEPQEVLILEHAKPTVQLRATVEAPGTLVKRGSGMVIDYSNTAQGYVMVRCETETTQRIKVRLIGPTTTYTYNLTPLEWTAFPLSDENGVYQIVIYRNVVGTKYATVLSLTVEVTLEDPFAPFLRSNQYVNFDNAPNAVAQAVALTVDLYDPLEKVAVIYDYVIDHLTYDQKLASTVKSGYLPDLDQVLEKGKGICFDYAALVTGMLRSQGIPAKLVVGYAGSVYHAWISVWTESTGWVDGVIYFDGTSWKRMDPTFASSGGRSEEIMTFIGDNTNYNAKYFY